MKPTPDPSQQAGRRAANSSCLRHLEMNGLRYVHMAVTMGSGGCVLDTFLPADPRGGRSPRGDGPQHVAVRLVFEQLPDSKDPISGDNHVVLCHPGPEG